MIKGLFLLFFAFLPGACGSSSDDDGGDDSAISYTYQITVTAALAFSTDFILQWNEDSDGKITGVYTDRSSSETLTVTGLSNSSGRDMSATRTSAISGVLSLKFILTKTGDLSGPVIVTVKQFDANSAQVGSDQVITATATTAGVSSSTETETDSGGMGTLNSYIGLYTGTITEVSNSTIAGGVGNGKYCDLSFSGSELKFELSKYLMFGYSVKHSNGDGAYQDVTDADPAKLDVAINKGYPSATLGDAGYQDTGIKIAAADQSAGKKLTITFTGAFAGTSTQTLTGTLTAQLDTTAICSFTITMTKQ